MTQNEVCLSFAEALEQMRTGDAALSSIMLDALSAPSSRDTQLFRGEWPSLPADRRRKIVTGLAESAEANFELDFTALFRVAMEDADGQVRAVAIEGLWEDEHISLIAPLVRVLQHDQTVSARAAAAASLGRFVLLLELGEVEDRHSQSIRGALMAAIQNQSEDIEVRRRAVESIAYWDDPSVTDVIADSYQEVEELMRVSAVFAMGRSADAAWSDTVCEELSSPNPAMRYEAARACGELEVKQAVPNLIQLLTGRDREVQFAAVAALGQLGGQRAKRALERSARSSDEAMRLAAEDALGELELGRKPQELLVFDSETESGEDAAAGARGATLGQRPREKETQRGAVEDEDDEDEDED